MNPAPGFTRTFLNVKEFFSFAKAEFMQQEPSSLSWEEAVCAREERVTAEEELLNAREHRLSNQQKELQQRLRALEAQKRAFLEAEEAFQVRAALDKERLEQGMLNTEWWTRMEMETASKEAIRAKDEAIKSRDQKISRLKKDLAHEEKRREQAREDLRRI